MKVSDSVWQAISDWQHGREESAMLHCCNAVDGTAKKAYPSLGNRERFTRFLRDNYDILGPMGLPGIDIFTTRFPVKVKKSTTTDRRPDIADVIYGIHRCVHAHGDEIPDGFQLLNDAPFLAQSTRIRIAKNQIALSDRVIFGMIACAVFSYCNKDQLCSNCVYLTYGGNLKFVINEWWGRKVEFLAAIYDRVPREKIVLDFGDWVPVCK